MKNIPITFRLITLFLFIFLLFSCKSKEKLQPPKLVIKQDSISVFVLKNYESTRFWQNIAQIYSNDNNIKIKYRFFGNIKTLLDSLKYADVVLGIDKTNFAFLQQDTLFVDYRPINYQYIKRAFRPAINNRLIPFAYNYNVMFYKKIIKDYPKTLAVLQDHDLIGRTILFNPQKTFLGRDFILQSIATYTNLGCRRFWRGIRKSVYKIENSLYDAANDFKEKDVFMIYFPLVNPYIQNTDYYLPQEGYFCSVFYMGIPNSAPIPEKSKRFIDFMLFDKAQNEIFASNYAIPISTEVLDYVADKIMLKKKGKNLCNKPKPKIIRTNFKYLKRVWKRTFRKK